jgi:hypothetical protein
MWCVSDVSASTKAVLLGTNIHKKSILHFQMAHDSILSDGPLNPFRYDLVPMFQNITENDKTYFILTAYFVQPG